MKLKSFIVLLFAFSVVCCAEKEVDMNKVPLDDSSKKEKTVSFKNTEENLEENNNHLKIIKALGGDGRNVDWKKIEKEYNLTRDKYEELDFFDNMCSQGIIITEVSSQLSNQGKMSYGKKQLNDSNPNTAWVEGNPDYGIGEYFVTKGLCPNIIYNGYQNSPTNWKNNSRVKRFKIYVNNKPYAYLDLTDEMGAQRFDCLLGEYGGSDEFKFEIVDVYKGEKWSDVAISEIDYRGCCFSLDTKILTSNKNLFQKNVKEGDTIVTVEPQTNEISKARVEKISSVKHTHLVHLKTKSHSIKVTRNHPLFFEGIGFSSLQQLDKKIQKGKDLTSNYPRILTFDEKTKKTVFEKITNLTEINELVETYTISKTSNNANYVANGFITKPYEYSLSSK